MPHISIAMYPGRDDATKTEIAEKTRDFLARELAIPAQAFTVSIEDVSKEDWADFMEKVPADKLYVKAE